MAPTLCDIHDKLCAILDALTATPDPVVTVDFEYVCNSATGNYDRHEIVVTDGVAAPLVVTPTAFPCDVPPPQVEQVRVCRNGTVHIVTNEIDPVTDTVTEISAVDTGEVCEPCPETTAENVLCADETGVTVGGTPVAVDDELLRIKRIDCNDVEVASTLWHVASGEQITTAIATKQCSPARDVETVRTCFKDANGDQWSQIGIIDPADASNVTVLYYDDDLALGTPAGTSADWTPCEGTYVAYDDVKLCEVNARFLLLIDSGGAFAKYSFFTGEWTNISTLSVASAGGSADVENYLLYNFVAPNELTVVDVNTDIQLPSITLTSGILKPGLAANPLTFSAAAFRTANGRLYAWDTAGTDAGLYSVDVNTGVVDFVTTISGVGGAGTSIAIDNLTDTLVINGSNLTYTVDWATGVATYWNNPPIQPNGSTFDTDGNFYVTRNNDTYMLPVGLDGDDPDNWVQLIDDWGPGANSLAYYEVIAPQPACFFRRYGILADGTKELIGDFTVDTNQPRTIVGDVDCCECSCSGGGSSTTSSAETVNRVSQHFRTSGNNTYGSPFRSFALTALSGDVTLNGQAVPQNMTVVLDTPENERHVTNQVVTGSDYFVTYVTS